MDIRFYMFARSTREEGFARLAGQVAGMGKQICAIAPDMAKAENYSNALWQNHEFLPHGLGEPDALTNITITDKATDTEIIFAMDDVEIPDAKCERICLLFHASDVDIVNKRRADWKRLAESDTEISYWAEQDDGKWVKQAEANVS